MKKSPAIIRTVELLDPYFKGEESIITSGLRSPLDQLRIILQKANRHGITDDFPELDDNEDAGIEHRVYIVELNRHLYWWQRVWSRLLSLGDVVNPPAPAECLYDYVRPGSSQNKRGEIIFLSNHQKGLAFDIGGGTNLIEKAKRVMRAKAEGDCFIHNFLVEHINACCHVDVMKV